MPAKLVSRLPAIIAQMTVGSKVAAEQAAQEIADRARSRAPVVTGELQGSIHVEPVDNGYMVIADATDAKGYAYAQVVEYGGHSGGNGVGPHAFLTPAAEEVRDSYYAAIRTTVTAG